MQIGIVNRVVEPAWPRDFHEELTRRTSNTIPGHLNAFPITPVPSGGGANGSSKYSRIVKVEMKENDVAVVSFLAEELRWEMLNLSELSAGDKTFMSYLDNKTQSASKVIIDCSGLKFVDSEALAKIFIVPRKSLPGKKVIYCCVGEEIGEVLKTTKLEGMVKPYKTLDEAIQGVSAS